MAAVFFSACSDNKGSLEYITNNNILTAVTEDDFAPFSYLHSGSVRGVDVDLLNAIAAELGVRVEIKTINFKMMFIHISGGNAAIGMGGITITEERKKTVDFSIPYFKASQVAIVRAGSEIKTRDDLAKKRIGVQAGTTGNEFAKAAFPHAVVRAYYDLFAAQNAFKRDEFDVLVIDDSVANELVRNNPSAYTILPEALTAEEYGFCVKKGNAELLARINKILQRFIDEGKIAELYEKHTQPK